MKGPILTMAALGCCLRLALADPAGGLTPERQFPGLRPSQTVNTEEVRFTNPRLAPVKLIRGSSQLPPGAIAASTEVLSFGGPGSQKVTIARGAPIVAPEMRKPLRIESVSFADLRQGAVTIVRGLGQAEPIDFFAPAQQGELDQLAFAVEGIESRHGADPGMWRAHWEGPQGPMQVSLGAAIDVGGGDRFDLHQNRMLGRAYLAQMFRRYGNWPDALAAYNWGPANLDSWITAGRGADQLPSDVAQYVARVLRDTLTVNDRITKVDFSVNRYRAGGF